MCNFRNLDNVSASSCSVELIAIIYFSSVPLLAISNIYSHKEYSMDIIDNSLKAFVVCGDTGWEE